QGDAAVGRVVKVDSAVAGFPVGGAEANFLVGRQFTQLAAAQLDLGRRGRGARRQHEIVAAVLVFGRVEIHVGFGEFERRFGRQFLARGRRALSLLGFFLFGLAQLGVQVDLVGQDRGVAAIVALGGRVETNVAVRRALGRRRVQGHGARVAGGRYDLHVAVALAFRWNDAHAAIRGGNPRLGAGRRFVDHFHVAVAGDLEIEVAALGDETHVAVAALLWRRRFRSARAPLAAAAGLVGRDVRADVHLIFRNF